MLSALTRKPEPVVEVRADPWGIWPGDTAPGTAPVPTVSTAMQLLAVAGCVRLITESIATLPTDVYRELGDGTRQEQPKPAWVKEPTRDLDFTSWATQVLSSLLLHGNSYSAVLRSGMTIRELVPIDPARVAVDRVAGRLQYRVNGVVFTGEIMHIKGMMLAGADVGLSPLEYARQSIALGLSAQQYGSDNFDSSLNMPGVIQIPGVEDPGQMSAMAQSWRRARTRKGRGLPGVLSGGATWTATGVTNEQAQFLQTRQWTAAEIAAQVYLVDPRELGIPLTGSTLEYNNSQSRKADLLRKSLLPWIIRLETALSNLLPQPRYFKFNTNGFLRADPSERWTQYGQAMTINTQASTLGQPPVLTTVEMRDFEELGPPEDPPAVPAPAP